MMLIICLIYLRIILVTLGCLRLLSLLVVLELLSWLFVILLPSTSTLNYLIIQSYFLIAGLFRVIVLPFLLIVRFLLKLGLPPFHIWFIRISRTLNKFSFSFIITIHKLLPILFLRKVLLRLFSFTIMYFRLFITGVALIRASTLFFTLIFSSIVHTIWIRFRVLLRKSFLVFYWILYRILFLILISLITFMKLEQSLLIQRRFTSKCWLLMSGIPPFIIFWIKVYLLIWLLSRVGFFMRFLIMLVRVFALTSYYRTWHYGSLVENRYIRGMSFGPLLIILIFWSLF